MKNYERIKTEYYHLFRWVYWGYNVSEEPLGKMEAIFKNRHRFAAEWRLKSRVVVRDSFDLELFDHVEQYRTSWGAFVMITSPYATARALNKMAAEYGFRKYPKLYAPSTQTYIRIFRNKIWYNRFVREFNQRNPL